MDSQQQAVADSWNEPEAMCAGCHVPVYPNEIIGTIKNLRSKAASGLDGISCLVLKYCLFILLPFLLRLYNGSLQLGYVPVAWRKAKVIALKKPGKTDYSAVKSYRPISLLSILGKTLECIINRRLVRLLECRRLLSPFQLGYRKGKEMADAGWRLTHDVVEAMQTRYQVQAVALDIQSVTSSSGSPAVSAGQAASISR